MSEQPGCTCDACRDLAARYANDPALLAFYRKKLPIRGWAGQTDDIEKAYILAHAEWARGAAERGRAMLARYPKFGQKVHYEALSIGEEVSEDIRELVAMSSPA